MKKLINKILDDYVADKLIELCKSEALVNNLCCRAEDSGFYIRIYVKIRAYKDEYYRHILSFRKEEAFQYLFNFNEFKEILHRAFKQYIKEN